MKRQLTNPKTQAVLISSLSDADAADYILKHKRDDDFALDLANKFWMCEASKKTPKPQLSALQIFWLHVKAGGQFVSKTPTEKVADDFSRVHAMFVNAALHVRRPKIHLTDTEGHELVLSLAGPASKNPGCVYVCDDAHNYYGKIDKDGNFTASPRNAPPATVLPYLREFAKHPEEVAAKWGKLHGKCCFCMRSLCDERSTELGYGPICAERFQLSWGSRKFSFTK